MNSKIKQYLHMKNLLSTNIQVWVLLCLTFSVLTFNKHVNAQVKSEEVTVVGAYEPSLSDVFKININPEMPELQIREPDLQYSITPRLYSTVFVPEKITAARLSGEPLSRLYQSYIKAGFGNYTTPFVELNYNNLRSRVGNIGLYLKHHSSSGEIVDFAPANFSDNIAHIYGRRFTSNHVFDGDIRYERNRINYYGFKPDEFLIDNDDIDDLIFQRYNNIGLSASVRSNYRGDEQLNHKFMLGYNNLSDFDGIAENSLSFKAHIDKSVRMINLLDKEKLSLGFDVAYFNNRYLLENLNATLFEVKPRYQIGSEHYKLNLGIDAIIESAEDAYIHFFPIIEGQITVAPDVFSIYGALSGGMQRNSLKALSDENPFINTVSLPLEFTTENVALSGGVKGQVANRLSFSIGGKFAETDNIPFFINDTSNIMHNKFTITHYDGTHVNVFAEFSLWASDDFDMMFRGAFNYYNIDAQEHAWHKPALKGHLTARYRFVDKIRLRAELFAQGKTFAKTYDEEMAVKPKEIKPFVDANLGVEYLYTQRLAAFLNINNLTASRYYRWYNYPTQRFHFLAGVSYAF